MSKAKHRKGIHPQTKKVNILLFVSVADENWDNTLGSKKDRLKLYNKIQGDIDLTQEEYDLLKEVLLW